MLEKVIIKSTVDLMRCSETKAVSLSQITAYSISHELISDTFSKEQILNGGVEMLETCVYTLIAERCAMESANLTRWKGRTISLGESRTYSSDSGEQTELVSVVEMKHNNSGKIFYVEAVVGENGCYCVPYTVRNEKRKVFNSMCAVMV